MADFSPIKVGHFHCEYVGPTNMGHRWRVTNETTAHHYHTYGTREEVEKMCSTSVAAWKRRWKTMGTVGGAWRANYQKKTNGKAKKKKAEEDSAKA